MCLKKLRYGVELSTCRVSSHGFIGCAHGSNLVHSVIGDVIETRSARSADSTKTSESWSQDATSNQWPCDPQNSTFQLKSSETLRYSGSHHSS